MLAVVTSLSEPDSQLETKDSTLSALGRGERLTGCLAWVENAGVPENRDVGRSWKTQDGMGDGGLLSPTLLFIPALGLLSWEGEPPSRCRVEQARQLIACRPTVRNLGH